MLYMYNLDVVYRAVTTVTVMKVVSNSINDRRRGVGTKVVGYYICKTFKLN